MRPVVWLKIVMSSDDPAELAIAWDAAVEAGLVFDTGEYDGEKNAKTRGGTRDLIKRVFVPLSHGSEPIDGNSYVSLTVGDPWSRDDGDMLQSRVRFDAAVWKAMRADIRADRQVRGLFAESLPHDYIF